MSRPQATRCTQRQLAWLAYWQGRGYRIGRDEPIPENVAVPPRSADRVRPVEFIVTGLLLGALVIWGYLVCATLNKSG